VSPEEPEPIAIDTIKVIAIGTALWGLALVVTLLVPALHEGDKHWWPWTCVAAFLGGAFGLLYVRRGRGNAATSGARRRSGPG
jgi:hypothetical protein